ncbi:MAG: hypothetical protein IJW20_02565 [Clostridia bacterium]|nr:hypothetical protein [Clostridia bacterium]
METTFTSVFYENSQKEAEIRLAKLRKTDKYPEVKAYIIEEDGKWRVLRKIRIELKQPPKAKPEK